LCRGERESETVNTRRETRGCRLEALTRDERAT
jgi:hypothetical protein